MVKFANFQKNAFCKVRFSNLAKDFKSETRMPFMNVHQCRDIYPKLSVLKCCGNFCCFSTFLTTPTAQGHLPQDPHHPAPALAPPVLHCCTHTTSGCYKVSKIICTFHLIHLLLVYFQLSTDVRLYVCAELEKCRIGTHIDIFITYTYF